MLVFVVMRNDKPYNQSYSLVDYMSVGHQQLIYI